jgi:hypothetical protein
MPMKLRMRELYCHSITVFQLRIIDNGSCWILNDEVRNNFTREASQQNNGSLYLTVKVYCNH